MATYKTKDGIVLKDVPSGTPESEIKARIEAIRSGDKKAFVPNEILSNPVEPVNELAGMSQPEQEALSISRVPQTGFEQGMQATALGVNTLIGEGAEWMAEYVPDKVKEEFSSYMETMMRNPINQLGMSALQKGGKEWDRFKQAQPRIARDVSSAAQLATIGAAGVKQGIKGYKRYNMDEALKPYMNQANIGQMMQDGRLVGGVTSKFKFVNTPMVQRQKAALKTVPGLHSMQSNISRRTAVNNEIGKSSDRLIARLEGLDNTTKGILPKDKINMVLSPKSIQSKFNKGLDRSERISKKEYHQINNDIRNRIVSDRADGGVNISKLHKERMAADKRFRELNSARRASGDLAESRAERIWRVKRDLLNGMVDVISPQTKSERLRISTLYDIREIFHQKALKGQASYYQDVKQKIPFVNDAVQIRPGGGR